MDKSEALRMISEEYDEAELHNAPFHSAHEGFAVILEEVDELRAEVWKSRLERKRNAQIQEAVQIGAMALRYLIDLC